MKVITETITKAIMSKEEYATINNMIIILDDIYYSRDAETEKNIEREWKKQDLNFGVEDVMIALEVLRDLVAVVQQ
jgi:hypothetical protein